MRFDPLVISDFVCSFISPVHFNQWLFLCAKESSSVSRSIVFMTLYSYLLFFWNLVCGGCILEFVNWILFTNIMSMVPFLCKLIGLCIMWEACLYIKEARLLMKPMLSDPPIFSQSLSMSHENYKHCNIAFFFFPWWSKVKCKSSVLKRGKIRATNLGFCSQWFKVGV